MIGLIHSLLTNELLKASSNQLPTSYLLSHTSCSLMCYTYTQLSICVAPASSAVWFAPVLSSDTGTWLWLHWFAAGGAPTHAAWRWHTHPPDTQKQRKCQQSERVLFTFTFPEEQLAKHFQQNRVQYSHGCTHSPLIDSQLDHSWVCGIQSRFTGPVGG